MKSKIITLILIGFGLIFSFRPSLNTQALDLADPTGWDYKYDFDATSNRFEFTSLSYGDAGAPLRWLYSSTNTQYYTDPDYIINPPYPNNDSDYPAPFGISINLFRTTTVFNLSDGYYYPTAGATLLGSNSTLTPALPKVGVDLYNYQNNYMMVGLNITDGADTGNWSFFYKNIYGGDTPMSLDGTAGTFIRSSFNIRYLALPPYSRLSINSPSTTQNVQLRTIWVGVGGSPSIPTYQDGFIAGNDYGYDQGFLDGQDSAESNITSRISNLISNVFNGLASIFNIRIFDGLTMGTVMLFPLAFVIFSFIFRLIRGGRS